MLEMPYVTTGKFNRHGFQWCIKEHAILKDIYCKKKKKKKKEREREREKEKRERLLVFLVLFCCSRFYFGGLQRSVYLD